MPERPYTKNYQNIMNPKIILYCFTYAGGNASFYDQLEKAISPYIQLRKMEYAGHGARHNENFYADFNELADDMYNCIKTQYTPGIPYALMGYSMGSISAIEVLTRIVLEQEMELPLHVFLAAHEPRTKMELASFSGREADEKVKERTIKFGGIPEQLLNNRAFWRMYLPIYRADYAIIGKYSFENLSMKFQIPATVFYSEQDTPFDEMSHWGEIFAGDCSFFCYDGNHFFIQEHCDEIARKIEERLGVLS